jgi:hypothetical protein
MAARGKQPKRSRRRRKSRGVQGGGQYAGPGSCTQNPASPGREHFSFGETRANDVRVYERGRLRR